LPKNMYLTPVDIQIDTRVRILYNMWDELNQLLLISAYYDSVGVGVFLYTNRTEYTYTFVIKN
jgi:hypothetical protein